MRVNSISNNNYQSQKQQSFGAIPGNDFSEGLIKFMTHFYRSEEKASAALSSKEAKIFMEGFAALKVGDSKKVDHVINLEYAEFSDTFNLSAILSGVSPGYLAPPISPKNVPAGSSPFDYLAQQMATITEKFQEKIMSGITGKTDSNYIRSVVQALVESVYLPAK